MPDEGSLQNAEAGRDALRINWTLEEMVLAADVADDLEWRGVNSKTVRVVDLSVLLRAAKYHPVAQRDENFRSPGSIGMKINNLRKSHPAHRGVGLRATGSEAEVVQLFLDDLPSMKAAAAELRRRIAGGGERLGDAIHVLRMRV